MKKNKKSKLKILKKKTKVVIGFSTLGVIALSIAVPILTLNKKVITKNQELPKIETNKKTEIYWEYNKKKYKTYNEAYKALAKHFKETGDGSGNTYTQAKIDARDAKGPFPTPKNALSGRAQVGENVAKIDATGDGSGNTYTQAQINHAKGENFVAPKNAILGKNTRPTGDGSGNTYTQAKIDARDAKGPFPTPENALSGRAQVGENVAKINATGDGSGNTYTQAKIDARDAKGPFPTPKNALIGRAQVGENVAKINATGDGSGNTYTQAQIDYSRGDDFVAPTGAVLGLNKRKTTIDTSFEPLTSKNFDLLLRLGSIIRTYNLFKSRVITLTSKDNYSISFSQILHKVVFLKDMINFGFKNSVVKDFEKFISDKVWDNDTNVGLSISSVVPEFDIRNKKINWYLSRDIAQTGDGSGNTYTQAKIDARDAKGPFPTPENALSGRAQVGENVAKIDATGDGSGNTYTQAQINHAKGENFVAPKNAILGENISNVDQTGDGSGNTYTQAQINHAKGENFVAPKNAILGKNTRPTGDGSGNTYTQAKIDARDAKGPFPTPKNALSGRAQVGENVAKINATGDGSGNTYTQAQIDYSIGGDFVAPENAILGENKWYVDLKELAKELIKKITIYRIKKN